MMVTPAAANVTARFAPVEMGSTIFVFFFEQIVSVYELGKITSLLTKKTRPVEMGSTITTTRLL
jgi:hypothetical protein